MILDGKSLALALNNALINKINKLKKTPNLAVILLGEDKASCVYVRNKEQACAAVGINSTTYRLSADTTEAELLALIARLNEDADVDAILVQLPLPKAINQKAVIDAIDVKKDVDGFHPANLGLLFSKDESGLIACTPKGIIKLLEHYEINLNGANVCVIGESIIVGRPLAALLLNHNASVDICHIYTKNLAEHTKRADIIISATGKSDLISANMVSENAVLIDVGIALNGANGDISKEAKQKAKAYSPVPGGVGPMTVAMLLANTYEAALRRVNG